jgi:hypothetical protein
LLFALILDSKQTNALNISDMVAYCADAIKHTNKSETNTSRRSTKPQEKRAEFQRQQVRNRMRCHALLCWKEGAVIRGKKEDYHECSSTVDDGKDCKEDIIVRDGL